MPKFVPLLFGFLLVSFTAAQAQVSFNPNDYVTKWPPVKPVVAIQPRESITPMNFTCGCGSRKPEDQPVYVIDDRQTATGLASLNPNQIEKIDVSRDKKWIQVYGDQAKNGVIFLTLKKPATSTEPVQ